jgi:TnpA family transposase
MVFHFTRSGGNACFFVGCCGVPTDEETLIRHYTLGSAELDFIQTKIAPHNQLGLAIQLCLMRHPGRAWRHGEILPASFVSFVAEQVAVPSNALADYVQRDTTRREHASEAQRHLGLHPADHQDRRAALMRAASISTSITSTPAARATIFSSFSRYYAS